MSRARRADVVSAAVEALGAWPFFYGDSEPVVGRLTRDTRQDVFYGARGCGKSTVLSVLRRARAGQAEPGPEGFIEGRDRARAVKDLETLASSGYRGDLYVDDVDQLLAPRDADDPVDQVRVTRALQEVIREVRDTGARCLVTATVPLREVYTIRDTLSLYFMDFVSVFLEPWKLDWPGLLSRFLSEILEPPLVPGWSETIREVTGCHPLLAGAALRRVREMGASAGEGAREPLHARPDERVRLLEYQLARTALGPLRRRIRLLEEGNAAASEWLRRIARDEAGLQVPYAVLEVLEREGLVYSPDEGLAGRVPGGLLRAEVLRDAEDTAGPRLVLEPSADAPEKRGVLALHDGGRRLEAALNGGAWRIASVLFHRGTDPVMLEEITAAASMASDTATRSALQRLGEQLKRAELDHVLENVWGAGYRLRAHSVPAGGRD